MKLFRSAIGLILAITAHTFVLAANRSVTISAPSSVYAGASFSVPTSASTDQGGNGEQIGFYHAEYSTNGGASWTGIVYDYNVGTSASRTAYITAGGAGSTIIVRVKIAFRFGSAGDVDYNGNGINWGGTWDTWGAPPTVYSYISVVPPPPVRDVTISAPATVYAGQSFTVPTSASTDQGSNGEQIGFYHLEYSTNGGASWNAVVYDANVGTSASRNVSITAGAAGTTIVVRAKIAFRSGSAGDVDYNGSPIDWGGSWNNWQAPPTKYAYISVNSGTNGITWNSFNQPAPVYVSTTATATGNVTNSGTRIWGSNHLTGIVNTAYTEGYAFTSINGIGFGASANQSWSWTAPSTAGTYTYYYRAVESGIEWFGPQGTVTLRVANRPTATISANSGSYTMGQTGTFTANYTINTANGDAVTQTAINLVPPSGSEFTIGTYGGAVTTLSRSYTLNQLGTWTMKAYVQTAIDSNWAMISSSTFSVVNSAPSISTFTVSPSTINFGQSTTVSSTIADIDGNLYCMGILLLAPDGSTWLRPPGLNYPRTGWNSAPVDSADFWTGANFSDDTASGGSTTKSIVFTPGQATSRVFHSNGHDGASWTVNGPSISLTVNKATPASAFAAATKTPPTGTAYHSVGSGDLNAAFTNPYSTTVAQPVSVVAYTIAPGSPSGTAGNSVMVGTQLPSGFTYKVRATYTAASDINYNTTYAEANWTINRATQNPLTVVANATQAYNTTQTLSATGGSGSGSVTFAIVNQSTANVATLSGANLTANTSTGWVDVRATKAEDANFNAISSDPLRITFGKASATVTLGNLTQTYAGTPRAVSVTTVPSGLTVNVTYNGSSTVPTVVGNYPVVATINDANYAGSASGTLIVSPAALTITGNNQVRTYGAANPTLTATFNGLVNGEPSTVVTGLTLTTAAAPTSSIGDYPITVANGSAANYVITRVNGTLTVNRAPLTITANNATRVFGAANPIFSASYSGFVNNETSSVVSGLVLATGATASSNVGGHQITASGASANNYAITHAPGILTITPLPVSFTFTGIAFVYDGAEKEPVINNPSGAPFSITGTNKATAAGNYSFTVNATGNYSGSAICNWSISAATATVILTNLSHTWDGTAKSAGATTVPAGLPVSFTYDDQAALPSNVGTYKVVGSVVDPTTNYSGSATGYLTITKAPQATLTLTANVTQVFATNQTLSAAGGTGTGTISYAITDQSGENVATLNGAVLTAITGTGWVKVVATKAADSNYAEKSSDPLTIDFTKAAATVTLGSLNQTYNGTPKAATATTTPVGLTVNLTYNSSGTVPTNAGNYAVAGTISDLNYVGSASGTLVIAKASQAALTLTAATTQVLGTSQTLSATGGTTGGAITYAIAAESTAGVTTLTGASLTANAGTGSADVRATMLGNANYLDVDSNTVRVQLAKAAANVSLGNLRQTYDGGSKSVAVTTTPGGLGLTVTYNGSTVAPVNVGSYPVTVVVNDANYSGSITGTLIVDPAQQVLVISPANPTVEYGRSIQLTASGSQTTYVWGGAASGTAASVTLTPNAGTQTVTVYAPASGNYARSADYSVPVSVSKATPTGTFTGKTASGPYTVTAADLNATFINTNNQAIPTGTTTYSVAPNTVLNAGTHTIRATYPGDANHVLVTVDATFTINKSTPAITWNPASIGYGQALGAAQLNATAPVAGTFDYTPSAGTLATAIGTKSLQTTFTPTDTTNYNPNSATATITVSKASQTINLPAIGTHTYGDEPFSLAGTTTSGLPIQYSVSPSNLASISLGSMLTIKGAGTITVTATQPGDGNYNAAPPVSQTFTVNKANQTINFPNPEANEYVLLATASSGLPVRYTSSNTSVAVIGAYEDTNPNLSPTKMLVFIGNNPTQGVTVTADQDGDANYNPAPSVTSPWQATNMANSDRWMTRPPAVLVQRASSYPLRYSTLSTFSPRFQVKEPGGNWVTFGGSFGSPRAMVNGDMSFSMIGVYQLRVVDIVNGVETVRTNSEIFINVMQGQTISFPQIPVLGVGDDFALGATASSGLPITYTLVSGPATLNGSTLHINAKGTITVKASQAGDSTYAPALDVTQTFKAVEPPRINLDSHIEPSDPKGDITGFGWAFDPEDGAPITVQLIIDGVAVPTSAVTTNVSRPDVQNANISNGWTPKNVTNSGWTFTYDLEQLNYGNHTAVVRATNSMGVSRDSASWNFTGGSTLRQQTIDFELPLSKSIGDAPFTISATASSGLPVTFFHVGGPITLSGNTVTLGTSPGVVVIRAVQDGNSVWAPKWVEKSFNLGLGGGTSWVPGLTNYPITLTVLGKGSGTVHLTVNNKGYTYTFPSGTSGWAEGAVTFDTIPSTPGFLFPELQLGAKYPVQVTSTSGVTDYVVKVSLPGYISQRIPVAIECGGSYVNSITKNEVISGVFDLRVVPVQVVPFATVDMGKYEVQNIVNFGLGSSRAGETAGIFSYTPGSRVGLIKGPATEDVWADETHVQVKVPSGYADLVHNGSSSTLRYFANGTYMVSGGFNDFSGATALATYTITGTNERKGTITRSSGGVTMVFEWEAPTPITTESTHSFGTHSGGGQQETWRETTDTVTYFWPWHASGADRTGLHERILRNVRTVNVPPGGARDYSYDPLKLYIKKYAISTIAAKADDKIASFETHTFNYSDTSLAFELDVSYGMGTEERMGPSRASDTNNFYAHKPVTTGNGLGGGTYTEYYTSNVLVAGSSNVGTEPSLAYGEVRTVRQSYLDNAVNNSNDLMTTYHYKSELIDGRAVPASTDTKQGSTAIGNSTFEYATGTLGPLTTVATAVTTKTTAGGPSLTKTVRSYSQRLSDINLRSKPIAVTNPDGTKTSYAYVRGTFSNGSWAPGGTGPDLLIAELNGKTGAAVTSYATATLDPLDMDANRSTVLERIVNRDGLVVREASYVYTGSSNFSQLNAVYFAYDVLGNLLMKADKPITITGSVLSTNGRVIYQAGYAGWRKSWEADEQGIKLSYTYDNYDRVWKMTRESATYGGNTIAETVTTYEYDKIGRLEVETISDTESDPLKHELPLVTKYTYDTGNRPKTRLVPGNLLMTTIYDPVLPTKTTTILAGGGDKVELLYLDGRVKSISGSAVTDVTTTYSYSATTGNETKVDSLSTGKKTTIVSDWMKRTVSVTNDTWLENGTRTVSNNYNSLGQLESQETKSGATRIAPTHLYFYDGYGRLQREGLDVDGVAGLDDASDYNIKEYEFAFQQGVSGYDAALNWYRYTAEKIWPYDGSKAASSRYASKHYEQISGLGTTTTSHEISIDFDRNVSETAVTVDRASALKTLSTTTSGTSQPVSQLFLNGLSISSTNAQGHTSIQTYDSLGRSESSDDPRTGVTTFEYYPGTYQIKSSTAADHESALYQYDAGGRVVVQADDIGKKAYYKYDDAGRLTHQWGETVSPVRYEYNELGQKTKMHAYRTGESWTSATFPETAFGQEGDVTTWAYQAKTGLLIEKKDPELPSPALARVPVKYEYNHLDQVTKRTDSRGWLASYEYSDPRGLLSKIDYSDGVTTDIIRKYDRAGRLKEVNDAAGKRSFDYYQDWTDATEGNQLRNKSARLQKETLPLWYNGPGNVERNLSYDYQYEVSHRLNGSLSVFKINGAAAYQVTYDYDEVMRLKTVSYQGVAPFTYNYVANSNLIDTITQDGGYSRVYHYEADSNRLEILKHSWGSLTASALESRMQYDLLGRRQTEKTRGTGFMSALLRPTETGIHTDYLYTDRSELDSSGKYRLTAAWDAGSALTGSSLDFSYDFMGNRNTGGFAANAMNQYTSAPGFGTFVYDENGNMVEDGSRTYGYDGENRLITIMQTGSTTITYSYDYLGRRISKSGGSTTATRYLYDGWNLIAELNSSGEITRRFGWGLDESGTVQGAGGVGGLLVIDTDNTDYYPLYDASHNVIALYNGSGAFAASYEYDAFGNRQSAAGTYADDNPFRSATKYTDAESGFVYYGLRYYAPALGRFINRDPIGESGGINLYAFCGNDGVNRVDVLGMSDYVKGDPFDNLFRRNDPRNDGSAPTSSDEGKTQDNNSMDQDGNVLTRDTLTFHSDGPRGANWYSEAEGDWSLWKFAQDQAARSMLEYTAQNSGVSLSQRVGTFFEYAAAISGGLNDFYVGAYVDPLVVMVSDTPGVHAFSAIHDFRKAWKHSGGFIAGIKEQQAAQRDSIKKLAITLVSPSKWTSRGVGNVTAATIALLSFRFLARGGGADSAPTPAATAVPKPPPPPPGDHLALGIKAFGLEQRAAQIGARTLLDDTFWRASLQTALETPSTRITVFLDGFEGATTMEQVMGAASRGALSTGAATEWEIAQLMRAGRLETTTFMRGGTTVPNPFGPQ